MKTVIIPNQNNNTSAKNDNFHIGKTPPSVKKGEVKFWVQTEIAGEQKETLNLVIGD